MSRPELVPDLMPEQEPTTSAEDVSAAVPAASTAPLLDRASSKTALGQPGRILVAGLVFALLVTCLALVNQVRKTSLLASEVSVLEAEVAATVSTVEAYRIRFDQVRAEVGGLVARVGVLSSLVERDVFPEGLSGTDSGVPPKPTYTD